MALPPCLLGSHNRQRRHEIAHGSRQSTRDA